ncbi:hypothetical protein K474DRAFT_1259855 [Panus rudis PR-1116 ss-1]|nr:hypothetical protein K474DRAFT_1259855 [Panus rudis PR-1116 ss-1]
MPRWAENMGRASHLTPPDDYSDVYPDKAEPTPVYLLIRDFHNPSKSGDEKQWIIYWEVYNDSDYAGSGNGTRWCRVMHLSPQTRSRPDATGASGSESESEQETYLYTYWGAVTVPLEERRQDISFDIGMTPWSLRDRQLLEGLAEMTPVQMPGGGYTCNDWIRSLLLNATAACLVKDEIRKWLLWIADPKRE